MSTALTSLIGIHQTVMKSKIFCLLAHQKTKRFGGMCWKSKFEFYHCCCNVMPEYSGAFDMCVVMSKPLHQRSHQIHAMKRRGNVIYCCFLQRVQKRIYALCVDTFWYYTSRYLIVKPNPSPDSRPMRQRTQILPITWKKYRWKQGYF